MQLTPYIMFNGNCEEALNFYVQAIGGEIKDLMRFEGSPAEGMSSDKKKVMHSHFQASGIFFMASDSGREGGTSEGGGAQVHLSVNCETEDQLNKLFNGLSEGGKVSMPLQDTFWGARFGMVQDKYGVNWMFNFEKPR